MNRKQRRQTAKEDSKDINQFRIRLNRSDLIPSLRERMLKTYSFSGNPISKKGKITASNVIDFALDIADKVMGTDLVMIDKQKFLDDVNQSLDEKFEVLQALEPEQRKAMVETLVISNSVMSSMDAKLPLRAAGISNDARN